MPQRGFIFDMDGTLADSMEHYYRMACDVTDLAEAPPVTRARVRELMGSGDPDLL
jgi:phosphoglycolate phosphatase-like HAD superfamily hydrolase